ncbi:hypothetical protein [Falsiroseomonas oryziterrae]|uniref:hypothetical protein n=1 Tax=Falsiroseomonas oryziterrae TaxID=2911368 RepID=UPI001F16CC09|nr:hypothetical protein [Roseomonas sp. NPKOSM-4]
MLTAPASDFGLKLRLTLLVLGCGGVKELSGRFHAVNPRTHFDLERAQKWLQGRATPRSAEVYEDWAKVLQTRQSAGWLASCTVEAFLDELHRLFGIPPETLLDRVRLHAHPPGPSAGRSGSAHGYLCGDYACYSLAWSPYFRGQLIRGALGIDVAAGRTRALAATYREHLLGRTVEFRGEVLIGGRTLHIDLREPGTSQPLLISLGLSGPPASALCGVMSGSIVLGPDPQPSATRFVMVRVPGAPDASNRYFEPTQEAVARDLAALGLKLPDAEHADALVRRFLFPEDAAALMQVSAAEHARLTLAFDQGYLEEPRPVPARVDAE